MASLFIYGVFLIFTAVAASAHNLVDASCMAASAKRVCDATLSSDSCYHRINQMVELGTNQSQTALQNSVRSSMDELSKASLDFVVNGAVEVLINNSKPSNGLALSALDSCRELISLAMDNLNNSLSCPIETDECRGNLKSWLCAAGSSLETCIYGFQDQDQGVRDRVFEMLKTPIDQTTDSTTLMAVIDSCVIDKTDMLGQDSSSTNSGDEYPQWLSPDDRRFLQDTKINANVVVAKDGSGKYTRVSDAIKVAPRLSKNRFVIYVKKGLYQEIVRIDKDQWNIVMFGDGMNETIISGSLSYGGGVTTLNTATFLVYGQGFIARDMGFQNTAGAINQQAVALASGADRSVFYRCRMDGFQDTLFVLFNRQFYRECQIYGTVDFIFGGASAVIQKSFIYARKPLQGQQNAFTAHFKTQPQCTAAIVVQSSVIAASGNLTGVRTYLGRPWTDYATVVFMENDFGQLIDPAGWLAWNTAPGAPPPPNTIFLAEYGNKGPSANTANRVNWGGVKRSISTAQANDFTVRSLIQGDMWLPATQVPFDLNL